MKFDEFVGQVQNRARLASEGQAFDAIKATLTVLGQRLAGGEAEDIAAQLPSQLQEYLLKEGYQDSFGVQEFFQRVSKLEKVDLPESVHHTRAVISVLRDAISPGEYADMLDQLPDEYKPLFEGQPEGEMA
ncbi:MAG: DUF2267 domain-containing protein [Chloroflexi bacterium]|jgi:uncharacterized protein (DUF2267 family)|nr:DUF2267 domain-containing protein [Chloroflexota bacterium]